MKFKFYHSNINVFDLDKSLNFYKESLGLIEIKRKESKDGSFILVFLGDGQTEYSLELTFIKNRKEKYNLGDNESHIAFKVDDYDGAYKKHKNMGCICYENPKMGIYFISDPDNYWIEIIPIER
ncbi:MAG: VOC family protein [Oscillospiraceae bacterium]|nr:VOC family protein [Oscillospiraceae bacterium]